MGSGHAGEAGAPAVCRPTSSRAAEDGLRGTRRRSLLRTHPATHPPSPFPDGDAQGCEYALYRDTIAAAPRFFEGVDQIVLEVHLSRKWAADDATFLEYGRLLGLLLRSGHVLRHAQSGFCSGGEVMGLAPLVGSSGYFRRAGGHCENLLFARLTR